MTNTDHERPSRQNETSQDPSTSQTKLPHAALRKLWGEIDASGDDADFAAFAEDHIPDLLDENDDLAARLARAEGENERLHAVVETCRLEIEEHKDRRGEASVEIDRLRARIAELEKVLLLAEKEMRGIDEPCDHDVGICWCDWHGTMDEINRVLRPSSKESGDG